MSVRTESVAAAATTRRLYSSWAPDSSEATNRVPMQDAVGAERERRDEAAAVGDPAGGEHGNASGGVHDLRDERERRDDARCGRRRQSPVR